MCRWSWKPGIGARVAGYIERTPARAWSGRVRSATSRESECVWAIATQYKMDSNWECLPWSAVGDYKTESYLWPTGTCVRSVSDG